MIAYACDRYARDHSHSETDLMWLFSSRKEPGTGSNMYSTHRGPWQTIAEALPYRTPASVYSAGTRLLHPMHYKVLPPPPGPIAPIHSRTHLHFMVLLTLAAP